MSRTLRGNTVSTKTTYRCDLCHCEYGTISEANAKLVGVHFDNSHWSPQPADRCETHICLDCIAAVRKIPASLAGEKADSTPAAHVAGQLYERFKSKGQLHGGGPAANV
jgi:hypothetical protein